MTRVCVTLFQIVVGLFGCRRIYAIRFCLVISGIYTKGECELVAGLSIVNVLGLEVARLDRGDVIGLL